MRNVMKIIETMRGGLDGLRDNSIQLDGPTSYMPLSIELIGTGPRGLPLISVMHWFLQNGDVMRDPDVEFEVDQAGAWHPISYRQDSLGLMQEAVFVQDGKVMIKPKLLADLKRFVRVWNSNIESQGYLAAAQA